MNYNSSIQQSHYPQGEFLAYGVLYAIGQDVGVGGGNLLERLVAATYLKRKSFSLISDFSQKSVSAITFSDDVLLWSFRSLRKATGLPVAFLLVLANRTT